MRRSEIAGWLGMGTLLCAIGVAPSAHAGSFDITDSLHADYKLTLGYAVAMRMQEPSNDLINGPVDPLQLAILPASSPSQIIGFGHTGLPTTINFDDGDRNFKKYSLINNRLNAYGEVQYQGRELWCGVQWLCFP
jgi:hypothetical protein